MKLRVELETESWVTRDADPDDKWGRDDMASRLNDLSVFQVDDDDRAEFEADVQVGDPVFVVVAHYSTGDTFGRSDGQVEVMDIFPDAATAYALCDFLENDPSETITKNGKRIETRFRAEFEGKDYYKPWVGYFEYLESLKVERSWVQRAQKERRYW